MKFILFLFLFSISLASKIKLKHQLGSEQDQKTFLEYLDKVQSYHINLRAQTKPNYKLKNIQFLQQKSKTFISNGSLVESPNTLDNSTIKKQNEQIVTLNNVKNSQYIGEITVDNDQKINVIFDTGSANLWFVSDECTTQYCYKISKKFNHNQSKNYKNLDIDLEVTFGTGKIKGQLCQDNISIGSNIKVQDQVFAEINEEIGSVFSQVQFGGILGLAYPQMAADNFEPFFDNLMSQKQLRNNIFAFFFTKYPVQESVILFGENDEKYYEKPITYFPVVKQYYWEIEMSDISVNGHKLNFCSQNNCRMALDSGTSLITGPSQDIVTLLRLVNTNSNCQNLEQLPIITFHIGKSEFSLHPDDYMIMNNNKTMCRMGFMPLDVQPPKGPLWVLGDIFMRKFYTVFDRDNNQVGIAISKSQHKPI